MQRILIIAENSLQQQKLCLALKFDRTVQLKTANLRQIHPKNIEALKRSDLIILENSRELRDISTSAHILPSLKATGLPIILLPTAGEAIAAPGVEPLVLNLSEERAAQPNLIALINQIRARYNTQEQLQNEKIASGSQPLLRDAQRGLDSTPEVEALDLFPVTLQPSYSPPKSDPSGKVVHALTAIGRIANQLREPLSNMNLAIHMLGKVQSIEERDRYVRLLREEYQRELQLVNELENLQTSLETIL
ncbi:hypothetical protein PN498_11710 [Oscillatoria sp. CS-180]|uniref:hypothetical protein n=1 Tax=Oscillatoria sp. CS-180 TaxID=3021720 RepID=UPI00232D864C|nr:hypothetical protein [Oscillatoria sp. CS-180]MDB9526659.1 hypothetical protein [Oscillatoria sp. CS-180]